MFKSDRQRKYLFSQKPSVAKKFSMDTPDILTPKKKKKKKMVDLLNGGY